MPFTFDSITEGDMVGEELKGNCVSRGTCKAAFHLLVLF
jgi:hypothetical protein